MLRMKPIDFFHYLIPARQRALTVSRKQKYENKLVDRMIKQLLIVFWIELSYRKIS